MLYHRNLCLHFKAIELNSAPPPVRYSSDLRDVISCAEHHRAGVTICALYSLARKCGRASSLASYHMCNMNLLHDSIQSACSAIPTSLRQPIKALCNSYIFLTAHLSLFTLLSCIDSVNCDIETYLPNCSFLLCLAGVDILFLCGSPKERTVCLVPPPPPNKTNSVAFSPQAICIY
jgi:hypothetical protein